MLFYRVRRIIKFFPGLSVRETNPGPLYKHYDVDNNKKTELVKFELSWDNSNHAVVSKPFDLNISVAELDALILSTINRLCENLLSFAQGNTKE